MLFPDVEGRFLLEYVDESVSLYATMSIQYVHSQLYVHLADDDVWIHGEDYDDDDD